MAMCGHVWPAAVIEITEYIHEIVREGAVATFPNGLGCAVMVRGEVGLGQVHEVREPRRGEEGSRERGGDVEHRRDSYQEGFEVPSVSGGCFGIGSESRGPVTSWSSGVGMGTEFENFWRIAHG